MIDKKIKRLVIIQSKKQFDHYTKNNKLSDDVLFPIGVEAIYEVDKSKFNHIRLNDFISQKRYEKAKLESEKKIDKLIDSLNFFSRKRKYSLEIGNYFSFQLFIVIGQIHYNQFIIQSLLQNIKIQKILLYQRENERKNFYKYRPDPDLIFGKILNLIIDDIDINFIGIKEKNDISIKNFIKQKLPNFIYKIYSFLLLKYKLSINSYFKYKLLLIGAPYDWLNLSNSESFNKIFKIDPLFYPTNFIYRSNTNNEILDILNNSITFFNKTIYDLSNFSKVIFSDLLMFEKDKEKIIKFLSPYKSIIGSVFVEPHENFIAHIASKNNKPVYLYQHGEKGQSEDETSLYTELLYTNSYFCYSNEIKNQYNKYIGLNNLKSVHAVGSVNKAVNWNKNGSYILYATGKWFGNGTNFPPKMDPDRRLYDAHIKILKYLNTLNSSKVIFKKNNTAFFNEIPYQDDFDNIIFEDKIPFTKLLKDAKVVILDTPATTLVESCTTNIPIFILNGRTKYLPKFVRQIKKRAVFSNSPEELLIDLQNFLVKGIYKPNVKDYTYYMNYCNTENKKYNTKKIIKTLTNN